MTDTTPNSVSSPSSLPAPGPDNAQTFLQRFAEALPLLGRYFIVIYPVFLYHILASILFPRGMPAQGQLLPWILVLLGLIAVQFIFEAGWNAMMFSAITTWLKTPSQPSPTSEQPAQSVIPFGLLKQFFPGMGAYGLSYLVGGFVWAILGLIPLGIFLGVGFNAIGVPPTVMALQTQATVEMTMTQEEIMKLMMHLPAAEQAQMSQWSMLMIGCLVLWMVIQALTQYWRPFVFVHQCNGAKALWHSVVYGVRHPFKTLTLSVVFAGAMVFSLALTAINDVMAMFGNFLLMLNVVYFGLLGFLILLTSHDVTPTLLPDDETP